MHHNPALCSVRNCTMPDTTGPAAVLVRVNAGTRAVHIVHQYGGESMPFPVCGAPGNTPDAYRAFRPVLVTEPGAVATCKRCVKAAA